MSTATQSIPPSPNEIGRDDLPGTAPLQTSRMGIPPLVNGDRLTADEYMRRYEATPDVRAELVEGVVYVSSPVSLDHAEPHLDLAGWVFVYRSLTPGVAGASDATVRLDLKNCPQPDIHLRIEEASGGRTRIGTDRCLVGAPELVVEVAVSTVSYDLHDKLEAYRRNQVLEYIVWRVADQAIDWFILREGQFARLETDASSIYRSETFPGLWLDSAALLQSDSASVIATLQQGLASPEHAAFAEHLAAQAAKIAAQAPATPQEPIA